MANDGKQKSPYLWVAVALVIVFFWWPRTIRFLIIDVIVIALCVLLGILARRNS